MAHRLRRRREAYLLVVKIYFFALDTIAALGRRPERRIRYEAQGAHPIPNGAARVPSQRLQAHDADTRKDATINMQSVNKQ